MNPVAARPETLIEAYVMDVVRRLPRKQRNDVGFELRALLAESLRGRAGDAGREPDEAMALELVRKFGQPDEVAARYHAPGLPIIPPAHNAAFAWTTFIGVGVQWAVSLPLAISGQLTPGLPESSSLGAWWVTYGLGALWWPGFLVTIMMIATFIRQRWPAAPDMWRPKLADSDHVNRPLHLLGLAAALVGIGFWIGHAWLVTTMTTTPYARALAFAPGFLETRAPVLLIYWAFSLVHMVVVIVEGRRRPLTRQVAIWMQVAAALLMLWFVFGGRIFANDPADQTAKMAIGLIALLILLQLGASLWRRRSRLRPPEMQHG